MIKVAIIDDHKIFRALLKEYLSNQKDIEVVVEEEDPRKFIQAVKTQKINIAIIDLYMPKMGGSSIVKILKQECPDIKIIMLSMNTDLKKISKLIDMGIHSYLSKCDDIEHLREAIHAVWENKIYKNRLFTEALYWNTLQNTRKGASLKNVEFTEREATIMQLLWQEKTNKEIAAEVFLGIRSIEKIRQDMKERLGVKTTIGLLKYALANHIITEDQHEPFLPARHHEHSFVF